MPFGTASCPCAGGSGGTDGSGATYVVSAGLLVSTGVKGVSLTTGSFSASGCSVCLVGAGVSIGAVLLGGSGSSGLTISLIAPINISTAIAIKSRFKDFFTLILLLKIPKRYLYFMPKICKRQYPTLIISTLHHHTEISCLYCIKQVKLKFVAERLVLTMWKRQPYAGLPLKSFFFTQKILQNIKMLWWLS